MLCLSAITAVVAGCGGSSNDSTVSLPKAQFLKRANAICRNAQRSKEEVMQHLLTENGDKPALSKVGQEKVVLQVTKPVAKMTQELEKLGLPQGAEDEAEAAIDHFSETVEEVESDPRATLEGSGGQFTEADKLAADVGLKQCAAF